MSSLKTIKFWFNNSLVSGPHAKYIFGYCRSSVPTKRDATQPMPCVFLIDFFLSYLFRHELCFVFAFRVNFFLTAAKNLQCRWLKTLEYDPSCLAAEQRLILLKLLSEKLFNFSIFVRTVVSLFLKELKSRGKLFIFDVHRS